MINPENLFNKLSLYGVNFYVGVPDSLLKSFCAYIDDVCLSGTHIISANEGNAVGIAVGYHLSTDKIPAVYMQNSGLGNAINPLVSIADNEVYKVPLLMIIGWRGEPNVPDEPQHVKQGQVTLGQLELLGIPYWILDASSNLDEILIAIFDRLTKANAPVAIVVRKDTFSEYKSQRKAPRISQLNREDALRELLQLAGDDLVISTTGKTSREVFELRTELKQTQQDFLTVGGMGHTASIALGVAQGNKGKCIVCLDGDGSVLMHLGAIPIIGGVKPKNFIHVLLNNAAHESVGGQPTVAGITDFKAIALACNYSSYQAAEDLDGIRNAWHILRSQNGPSLLEIKINIGSRNDLGRPTNTPEENKQAFMRKACD